MNNEEFDNNTKKQNWQKTVYMISIDVLIVTSSALEPLESLT